MRKLRIGWATLACVTVIAGCGGPTTPSDGGQNDAGHNDGGGDVCAGRTLCTTAGTSCDGDNLVTCAADADGCMVETRADCGASSQVCDATGGTAACVDPCTLIPEADRCDTADARSCSGDTLEVCTTDSNGCLVLERTDCADMPGGVCDASASSPMCVLPPDPCAAIPAAMRCDAAGTSCDGDNLVECAPDAFGCLVTTTTDCSSRAGGTCDATGTPACAFTGDPCDGVTQCAAAGTSCDGPNLVQCAPDAFGCLVETRTDCTATTFGFCDAEASPAAMCSTAATDPCMGMTECGTSASRSCTDSTTLDVCALNAFGCYVSTVTDCTTTSEVCSDAGGTALCADPCSLVRTCAATTYCDGDDLVTCAPDADGCLVPSDRTTCADTCDPAGTPACVDTACPDATPGFIDCTSGTIAGDTAMGTHVRNGYSGCTSLTYSGAEQLYRFRNNEAGPMEVEIVATRGSGSGDFDLFAFDAGDGTTSCTGASVTCLDSSTGTTATETVTFAADPGANAYIAYDIWGSSSTGTTDYTLQVTCTPIVCGDGVVMSGEACDDGNTDALDGCSDTCAVEAGYGCTGTPSTCSFLCGNGTRDSGETCDDGNTMPSDGCSGVCQAETGYSCYGAGAGSCYALASNATCAGAIALGSGVSGVDLRTGGAHPTGTGCGSSAGPVLYYTVDVPAHTRLTVSADDVGTPTWDLTLRSLADCSGSCLNAVDSSSTAAEQLSFSNATDATETHLFAVGADSSSTFGTFNVTTTTTPLASNASCAGATPITTTTTLTAQDLAGGGPRPSGTGCGGGTGNTALYYAVSIPAGSNVIVETDSTADLVLFTQAACADTGCTDSTDTPEYLFLTNPGATDITTIVGVRTWGTTLNTFDVSFTYTTPAPNATCAGAIDLGSASTTRTGEVVSNGGAPITGTDCGSAAGPDLWYSVTVPAGNTATITVTPSATFDATIRVVDSCGATACLDYVDGPGDGGAEIVAIANTGATDATYYVAVGTYSGPGTFDLDVDIARPVTYSSAPITAACVTTGTWTSLTRASPSSDDSTTSITALPFTLTYFGDGMSYFSTSTNGFAQLWSTSSGSPSSAFSNASIPNTSSPNSVVAPFWDDLYLGSGYDIRTQTLGTAGSQVFVIEWHNALPGSSGSPITFQAQFYEGTNVIEFHYCSIGTGTRESGSSATIGIESPAGDSGTEISQDTAGAVSTGSGFRLTPM